MKNRNVKTARILTLMLVACMGLSACNDNEESKPLPDIGITAPVDKSTLPSGMDIKISAFATDQNGTVARVDFYEGKNKLMEDTMAPFEYVWPEVKAGDYALSVTSVDADGNEMASTSITVKVVDPE